MLGLLGVPFIRIMTSTVLIHMASAGSLSHCEPGRGILGLRPLEKSKRQIMCSSYNDSFSPPASAITWGHFHEVGSISAHEKFQKKAKCKVEDPSWTLPLTPSWNKMLREHLPWVSQTWARFWDTHHSWKRQTSQQLHWKWGKRQHCMVRATNILSSSFHTCLNIAITRDL